MTDWDKIFMRIAKVIASKSWCLKNHVGCVIVDTENRVISIGYNGTPYMIPHCTTCLRVGVKSGTQSELCRGVHAEQNALTFANRRELVGATIYVTNLPCMNCARMIANSGIRKVVYECSNKINEKITEYLSIDCSLEVIVKYVK